MIMIMGKNDKDQVVKTTKSKSEKDIISEILDKKIRLRCIHKGHNGAKLTPVKNPKTKQYSSCVREVDAGGYIIFRDKDDKNPDKYIPVNLMIHLYEGKEFDLDNPIDKITWEAIKFSSLITDSEDTLDDSGNVIYPAKARSYGAIFYVERENKEVRKKNVKQRNIIKAQTYILDDTIENRKFVAKIDGKYILPSTTDDEIEEYLMTRASIDPDAIIKLYTGSDFKLRLIIINAKEKNIIINRAGTMYYGDQVLGRNIDVAVEYLTANKLILDQLIKDTHPDYFAE